MTPALNRLAQRMADLRGRRRTDAAPPIPAAPPPAEDPNALALRPHEAARRLGVCPRTLRRWRVPRVIIGGAVRYRPEDLAAYLAAHVVQSQPNGELNGQPQS